MHTLVASIVPSNADEKKVLWYSFDRDIIRIDTGSYNGQIYQTLTVVGTGTTKLYAYDWYENGKHAECTVIAGGGWPVCPKPTINSRESWGARDVISDRLVVQEREPEMIVFHHTADKFSSTDINEIKSEIRKVQNKQMEVVLLGDFESRLLNGFSPNTLNDNQKAAMKDLSKWLCYEYNLKFDKTTNISPIITHKIASGGTECPGDNVEPWVENDLKTYINNWHP